jgi:heat shock protein HslJ
MALPPLFLYVVPSAWTRRRNTGAWENLDMTAESLRSRFVHSLAAVLVVAMLGLGAAGPAPAAAEAFPFGREFLLDAAPMRGSKKVPIIDIGDAGAAEIELWCNSVKAQLIVAADTITIITGEASARQCAPERAHADEDFLAALNEVTNWRMEGSALVLTGGSRTLRFRTQTN